MVAGHRTDGVVRRSQGERDYGYLNKPKASAPKVEWTAERVGWLKDWFERGWSMGMMAKEFNAKGAPFTRNAVIGKVHRLGLVAKVVKVKKRSPRPKRDPSLALELNSPKARRTKEQVTEASVTIGLFKQHKPKVLPQPLDIDVASMTAPTCEPVLMSEAKDSQCHWPASDDMRDMRVCGGVVACGSYCAFHARIAYRSLPTVGRHAKYRKVQESDLVA